MHIGHTALLLEMAVQNCQTATQLNACENWYQQHIAPVIRQDSALAWNLLGTMQLQRVMIVASEPGPIVVIDDVEFDVE